jgi:hypothetical protein
MKENVIQASSVRLTDRRTQIEQLNLRFSLAKAVGADLIITHVVYMPPIAHGAYVPNMGSILEELGELALHNRSD